MKVTFEGRDWELDPSRIRVSQAMVIQSFTGMSVGDWEDSLDFKTGKDADGNDILLNPPPEWLKSLMALYWLMKAQSGVPCPIAEVDFEVTPFLVAYVQGVQAEIERAKAEAKPDPTSPPRSPGGPPSLTPATPTATTPPPPAPQEVVAATAYTRPATYGA